MIENIQGLTGLLRGVECRGVNMVKPVEIRKIYLRTKTDKEGFSTLSLSDEKLGTMLQIEVNDEAKELLKILTEDKNNG